MGAEHSVILLMQAPDLRRAMAANATEAVTIAPPQVASAAGARRMLWTADGGYLIVLREVPEGTELIAWGRRSGKARTLATFVPGTQVGEVQAMGGTDRIVVEETDTVRGGDATGTYRRVSLFSASSGSAIPLGQVRVENDQPYFGALVSDTRPVGIIERNDDKAKTWRAFGPDGRLGAEIAVPRSDGLMLDEAGFPIQIHRETDAGGKMPKMQSRRIDMMMGKAGVWKPWRPVPPHDDPDARLTVDTVSLGDPRGVRASGVVLALRGGKPDESGVVSTDGTEPLLSPKGDAVAYFDQGLAMVRTLTQIDRKAYDEALRQRAISEAVRRGKQVAIGILQYAADHNDVLPGQGVDIRSLTMPYVKDASQYEGFTYTFGGGAQTDIDKVAETEMGYVSGPGGRAVIYTDGHVKWRPDGS